MLLPPSFPILNPPMLRAVSLPFVRPPLPTSSTRISPADHPFLSPPWISPARHPFLPQPKAPLARRLFLSPSAQRCHLITTSCCLLRLKLPHKFSHPISVYPKALMLTAPFCLLEEFQQHSRRRSLGSAPTSSP
ncbi:unnamed protein product [Victoria cruziana]